MHTMLIVRKNTLLRFYNSILFVLCLFLSTHLFAERVEQITAPETKTTLKADPSATDASVIDSVKEGVQEAGQAASKPSKEPLMYIAGDSQYVLSVKARLPEFFYGSNLNLLNNDNPTDQQIYFRHTLDLYFEYHYGQISRGYDVVLARMNIRNKGVWGDFYSIASTTESTIREANVVFGNHKHALPRLFFWMRELWLQISLNELLGLPFCNLHTFTIGSFPFELGRGIALGSSYLTDASDLGFFGEYSIDQYAFGGKVSGELIKKRLIYDIYGSILENKSASYSSTNERIRAQEDNHRNDQARGFGIINYLVAARLRWTPFVGEKVNILFEPYGLYNHNPEQRIEFLGDAESDLITLGLAGELNVCNFDFGFDTAFNLGHQTVHGWDRNVIRIENLNGMLVSVNSQVVQTPVNQEPTVDSPAALNIKQNQAIINRSIQSALQNGQVIGSNSCGTLVNSKHRFTSPYINTYRGSMFVFDMAYNIRPHNLSLSATGGFTSGDMNPNKDLDRIGDSEINSRYDGFIGLEETYSGVRVKSAYLLSGSGKVPRLLAFPTDQVHDEFPTSVSRFTNLIFVGGALQWRPKWSCKRWNFNPNLYAYWQDVPTRLFDKKTRITRFADSFLGTELNTFIDAELIEDLRFYSIWAVFIPGGYYKDLAGLPFTRAQAQFIENKNVPDIINDRVTLLGHDPSYFINIGLEYRY